MILLIFGLGFGVLTAYRTVSSRGFVDNAAHAEGVVVAIKRGIYRKARSWPVVAFTTASGERIEFQSQVPNQSLLPVGTQVDVLYNEQEPSKARINSWIDLWGLTFLFGLMSLFFLGLGVIILVLLVKRGVGMNNSLSIR